MTTTQFMTSGPSNIMERYTLTFSDCTTAGTTQTFTLRTLTKGSIIKGVRIKHSTLFQNVGNSATCTCAVGSGAGATNAFAAAFDINQAVADTTAEMESGWKAVTYAADTLTATIASSANVNTLTAGVVNIDVEMWLEPDLTATGFVGNQSTAGGGLI